MLRIQHAVVEKTVVGFSVRRLRLLDHFFRIIKRIDKCDAVAQLLRRVSVAAADLHQPRRGPEIGENKLEFEVSLHDVRHIDPGEIRLIGRTLVPK